MRKVFSNHRRKNKMLKKPVLVPNINDVSKEGKKMEQGKVILQLAQDRIKLMTELKRLLLQQQRSLVDADTERIVRDAEAQLKCIEKIQALESEWQKCVEGIKARFRNSQGTAEQLVNMTLDEEDSVRFLAFTDQIKKLISEIDMIKRNNTLLIRNSLVLVRSTLQRLKGNGSGEAVYHPRRKQEMDTIVLDQKL